MKSIFMRILLGFAALVIGISIYAALQPNAFQVERSIVINAPRENIFPLLADLRNWEKWSVWIANDPTIRNSYEGEPDKVGGAQVWTSEKSGSGKMTLIEVLPGRLVRVRLNFIDFDSEAESELTLEPVEEGHKVTWIMTGSNDFKGKLFFLLFGERMLARQFDQGLLLLKGKAEVGGV